MDYLEFELRISEGGGGRYPVTVRSPAGEASGTLSLDPDGTELRRVLAVLENTRGQEQIEPPGVRNDPRKVRGVRFVRAEEPRNLDLVEAFGRRLFESLMDGDVGELYEDCQRRAREVGGKAAELEGVRDSDVRGLRLRLIVDAPDLAVLPWELLFDPDLDDFVCLRADTPLVRHLDLQWSAGTLTTEPPLRVLAMIGDSRGLDVEREREHMELAVEHLVARGDLELTWLDGHTTRALQSKLDEDEWHVFHFIGHGSFDEEQDEGVLWMEAPDGPESGPVHGVTANALSRLLVDHVDHDPPRLAVLNACEGARGSGEDLFSSTGAKLAREIPAVVSMQYEISDRAAIEFSRRFYETLVKGLAVDVAVTEARKAISIYLSDGAEWATPVLHMRSSDGRLFAVDYAGAIHRAPGRDRGIAQAPTDRDDLHVLLGKVRDAWIEGVLKQSVWDFARIDLGVDLPDAVDNAWRGVLEKQDGQDKRRADGILELFDDQSGSLLILGEPGAGKTTRLLQLTRDLLDRAERDASQRIPVVFQLASWNQPELVFREWLAGQLNEKYQIPRAVGRKWIKEGYVVPMLDGLDEVRTDMRADCVDAINAMSRHSGLESMVVSSRVKEYLELPNRLRLSGALRLQPMSRDQVVSQVRAIGAPLAALADLLETGDSGLLIEAQKPAMLSLMVHAYWDMSPRALELEGKPSAGARRNHVLDAYVAQMFRRLGSEAKSG